MKTIDYLPERIHQRRIQRHNLLRQMVLMIVSMVILLALSYTRQGQIRQAKADFKNLDVQVDNVRKQLGVRSELETQQADLLIKKRIDEDLGSRVNVLDVLSEIERILAKSIFLSNMQLEAVDVAVQVSTPESEKRAKKPKTKEVIVKRIKLTITGYAPTDVDLANFIAQLSAGPLFEDVNMVYARNQDFQGILAREFQAYCYVVR